MADDSWSEALGWVALPIGVVIGVANAVFGFRFSRWLISPMGFLFFSMLSYCLLFAYIDRISLTANGSFSFQIVSFIFFFARFVVH